MNLNPCKETLATIHQAVERLQEMTRVSKGFEICNGNPINIEVDANFNGQYYSKCFLMPCIIETWLRQDLFETTCRVWDKRTKNGRPADCIQ